MIAIRKTRSAMRAQPMKLRLRGAQRDVNGNLCCEAIETFNGRKVAEGGQCQWEGLIVIERGMEHLFEMGKKMAKGAKA